MFRILDLLKHGGNQPSRQGFPLFDLPIEILTDASPLSTRELSHLIVSRQSQRLLQPCIRLRGAARLIEAMLNLDYTKATVIANSDPEILFTTIRLARNHVTTPLQFAAREYNIRMLKIFLFAVEDNAPEKKEKFIQQLVTQKTFINFDSLWEHYAGFKTIFNFWLNSLRSDVEFNFAAAEFGRAQLTLLPRHFLAEMCHGYTGGIDGWHPTSSFDADPLPQRLIATDVTEHDLTHNAWNFAVFVLFAISISSHKKNNLLSSDNNQVNFFLLRGTNSDEAMHDGRLNGLMAIHARNALAFPTSLEIDAPAWLLANGIAALEHDLATLQALAALRSKEFAELINCLKNNLTVARPKPESSRCPIM